MPTHVFRNVDRAVPRGVFLATLRYSGGVSDRERESYPIAESRGTNDMDTPYPYPSGGAQLRVQVSQSESRRSDDEDDDTNRS